MNRLLNQLLQILNAPDITSSVVIDTIAYDTLGTFRKYLWRRKGGKQFGDVCRIIISPFTAVKSRE